MNRDSEEQQRVDLPLRMNEELRSQIEAAAKRSLRSMNREILYRLRDSFEREAVA